MPTYEFVCNNKKCKAFSTTYSIIQSMDDSHKYTCPECSKECQRILYPVSDLWRCNGAHKTDYPSK